MPSVRTDDNRVSIGRADQIRAGQVYVIRGTEMMPESDGNGGWQMRRKALPPQFVLARTDVVFRSATDIGHIRCVLVSDLGGMGTVFFETMLGMDEVNIPEHGMHDHHLERVPAGMARAYGLMREDNRKQDYEEMIEG